MRGGVLLVASSLALGLLSNAGAPALAAPSFALQAGPVHRIFGQDAIDTSIAVSRAGFPLSGSAASVVIARSDHFADALAGGPLAAARNGPLLITPGASTSNQSDPRVLAEIQRVVPRGGTVYILGGTLALSPNIDAQLTTNGYVVQRIART